MTRTTKNEQDVLQEVLDALAELDPSALEKIIRTVVTFYELDVRLPSTRSLQAPSLIKSSEKPSRAPQFSGHEVLSPKDFMLDKTPETDVERIICLAYYLAYYRDTEHFRTANITKLNTEAAQRKFANAAYAVNNATQSGYFVPAPKNNKQLSAMGERYVEMLPNREEAKKVVSRMRPKRKRKTTGKTDS